MHLDSCVTHQMVAESELALFLLKKNSTEFTVKSQDRINYTTWLKKIFQIEIAKMPRFDLPYKIQDQFSPKFLI